MPGSLATEAIDDWRVDGRAAGRDNGLMRSFPWRADDGWPYPDSELEVVDRAADPDDDLLSVATDRHLFDDLNPVERRVIDARFGLEGAEIRSMKQLQGELGIPRAELRMALGSGLAKLRSHLA